MSRDLDTVKLIDQATALINDPQLGFAASIEKPVQDVDVNGIPYILTVKIATGKTFDEIVNDVYSKIQEDTDELERKIWNMDRSKLGAKGLLFEGFIKRINNSGTEATDKDK